MPSPMETEVESSTAMIRTTSPTERSGVLRNTVQNFTCRISSSYTFGLVSHAKQILAYLWAQTVLLAAATSIIFCRDKHVFVTTKHVLGRDKSMLWRQNYVCRDKSFARQTYFCRHKRQAHLCREERRVLSPQTRVCRDKTFVGYKPYLWKLLPMIDTSRPVGPHPGTSHVTPVTRHTSDRQEERGAERESV